MGSLVRVRMLPIRPPFAPLLVSAALLGVGCGRDDQLARGSDSGAVGPRWVLDHAAWEPARAAEDAFPEHRPERVVCGMDGLFENLGVLEIETDVCNYVALVQSTSAPLEPGATLRFAFWHLQLFASEPGEGHLAFLIDGELLAEYRVSIPSAAYIETREIVLLRAYAPGAKAQVHLHNHGQNHWRIAPVELTP